MGGKKPLGVTILLLAAALILHVANTEHIQYVDTSLCFNISGIVLSSNVSSCGTHNQGWGGYPHTNVNSDIIRILLERQAARFPRLFVLEVGSFSGGSATRIVEQAKGLQLPPERFCMMCMDTWLGDVNMISDIMVDGRVNGFRSWLHWDAYHHAHIMQAFCGNLNTAKIVQDIVPFRAPSIVGMKTVQRFVNVRNLLRPALLYLDSAHEELETLIELGLAWNLVPEDGIIFGDDWSWPAVSGDVMRFAYLHGLSVHVLHGQWVLHKPTMVQHADNPSPMDTTLSFNRDFLLKTDIGRVNVVTHTSIESLKAAVAMF